MHETRTDKLQVRSGGVRTTRVISRDVRMLVLLVESRKTKQKVVLF